LANVTAVTTAQSIFVVFFALVVGLVVFFSVYLLSSTMWGGRWYRRRP